MRFYFTLVANLVHVRLMENEVILVARAKDGEGKNLIDRNRLTYQSKIKQNHSKNNDNSNNLHTSD